MSKIYVCDFCGKRSSKDGTQLGEAWNKYQKGLYGLDACDSCWRRLTDAFYSRKEVEAIIKRNVRATVKSITGKQYTDEPDD